MWKLTLYSSWGVSVAPNSTECLRTTQGYPTQHTEYPKILKVAQHPTTVNPVVNPLSVKTMFKHEWLFKKMGKHTRCSSLLKYFLPPKFDRVPEDNSRSPPLGTPSIQRYSGRRASEGGQSSGHSFICKDNVKTRMIYLRKWKNVPYIRLSPSKIDRMSEHNSKSIPTLSQADLYSAQLVNHVCVVLLTSWREDGDVVVGKEGLTPSLCCIKRKRVERKGGRGDPLVALHRIARQRQRRAEPLCYVASKGRRGVSTSKVG